MSACPTLDLGTARNSERPEALQEGVELFMEHGCLLVKSALHSDYVGELHRAYVDTYKAYFEDREFTDALNVGNKRTMITVDVTGPFNSPELYANPFVYPMLKALLSDQVILGGVGSVVSLPGALDQHTHRDHPNIYELTGEEATDAWVDILLPPYAITLIVPLVPLNATNGTTRLFVGSHLVSKSATLQMPSVDPVAELGDCILMDYRLLHSGTANRSQNPRPIMYMIYSRPWFRDSRNYRKQQPIRISDEAFRRVPARHRHLVDWLPR